MKSEQVPLRRCFPIKARSIKNEPLRAPERRPVQAKPVACEAPWSRRKEPPVRVPSRERQQWPRRAPEDSSHDQSRQQERGAVWRRPRGRKRRSERRASFLAACSLDPCSRTAQTHLRTHVAVKTNSFSVPRTRAVVETRSSAVFCVGVGMAAPHIDPAASSRTPKTPRWHSQVPASHGRARLTEHSV